MKATTIKSFVSNGKAVAVATMLFAAGNAEAVTRFRLIEGGPVEREWIPRIVGRLFEGISHFISAVINVPIG